MKRSGPDHPKIEAFAAALGVPRVQAIGHLELLWHFTDRYAPRGDVGRFADSQIEGRVDWEGERGVFVAALVQCHLADLHPDHRLTVHDWPEHAPDYTRRRMKNSGWAENDPIRDHSEKIQKSPDHSVEQSGPTKPYQALPSPTLETASSDFGLTPKPSDTVPPGTETPTQQARAVWPSLVEAASSHGKRWAAEPSKGRLRTIAARIRDDRLTPEQLVRIVHGAIALWGDSHGDFDPQQHLVPETLFRPSNWPKYLDAAPNSRNGRSPGAMSVDDLVDAYREKLGTNDPTQPQEEF